jgi:Transketolase, thiamine diphosphate binding domain/DeoC/LacD family aldolase
MNEPLEIAGQLDKLCVNTIRTLSMDAVQRANSGHPGTPMAMAPVAYCLWQRILRFDPNDPIWPNRDRFVLSMGHASMLLYSMLHLAGAAHIAAQLGAHIIKVKVPTAHVEQEAARKVYEKERIAVSSLADRIRHVVQCCFDGRRVAIFSGGATGSDESLLEEIRGIHAGGGFGSIIGRKVFQRKRSQALELLATIMSIYSGKGEPLRASA